MAEVETKLGGIDILINNAALFDFAPVTEITRDSYQRLVDVNVSGALFTLQAVASSMIRRGQGGKIINMASQAGRGIDRNGGISRLRRSRLFRRSDVQRRRRQLDELRAAYTKYGCRMLPCNPLCPEVSKS